MRAAVLCLVLAGVSLAVAREPKKCGRAVAQRATRAYLSGARLAPKPWGCEDIALPIGFGAEDSSQGLRITRRDVGEPLALLVDRVAPVTPARPRRRIVREFAVVGHRQRLVRLWTEEVIP